jgi:hypothetical protein
MIEPRCPYQHLTGNHIKHDHEPAPVTVKLDILRPVPFRINGKIDALEKSASSTVGGEGIEARFPLPPKAVS